MKKELAIMARYEVLTPSLEVTLAKFSISPLKGSALSVEEAADFQKALMRFLEAKGYKLEAVSQEFATEGVIYNI